MIYKKHLFVLRALLLLTLAFAGGVVTSCAGSSSECSSESEITTSHSSENVVSDTVSNEPDAVSEKTVPYEQDGICFSAESGFYDNEFYLDISAENGMTVYYTLDGSQPTLSSQKFTKPILINDRSSADNVLSAHTDIAQPADSVKAELPNSPVDKATVVRAIAVDSNGDQSDIVSCTYFVGFNDKASYYKNTKIISLITDESNLFDYEKGIYVLGKSYDDWLNGEEYDPETPEWFMPANYTQKGREWEREASIQLFDDGKIQLSQNIGIRTHGGATRSYTQKSFNVYARKDYGAPKVEYDLFSGKAISQADNKPVTEFDSFMLRNGGNDAMYTRFRDKLIQSLVSERQFLTQGMEPCILFINGEYWGHYEITEKLDDSFIKSHYGVPKKDVCIVKKDELDEGAEETFAEWQELRCWINETDFSDAAAYTELCDCVDMQGFIDYVSTELYINNSDWGAPNSAMWRAQTIDESNPYADGKWRFILFDTEFSSGIYGRTLANENSIEAFLEKDCFITDLFKAAMKNEDFRKGFAASFNEIADNNFDNERVSKAISDFSEEHRDMTTDTYDRFWRSSFGGIMGKSNFNDAVEEVSTFFNERNKYITGYVQQFIETYSEQQ